MSHQRPDMEVALAAAQAGAEVARADEFFWADDRGAFLRRGGSDEALTPSTQSRLVDINCDGPSTGRFSGRSC